jgi:gliding motility-associated-like protein
LKNLQILIPSMYDMPAYRNKHSLIPKTQSFMAKRLYTLLILVFGLLSVHQSEAQVTLYTTPSSITPAVGDVVSIKIAVKNFTNINSFQYTMEWDASLFQFVNLTSKSALPDSNSLQTNLFNAGALNFSWFTTASATLPDGTSIYTLNFKILAASTNYWMQFSGIGTSIEVVQAGTPLDPSQIIFGSLGVPPTNRPLGITTSSHTIPVSGKVCVGVTTQDFTNLTKAQWSMKWDSSVIKFDSISKINTTLGLNLTNFTTTQAVTNGRLAFNFTSATPKSVPAGDTLFKLCYTAIGANTTSTTVSSISTDAVITRSINSVLASTTLNPTNGTVLIKNPVAPGRLTFSAENAVGNVGDTVCVKIFTKNFKDLTFTKWGMRWDSTKLNFITSYLSNSTLGIDTLLLPSPAPNANYSSPLNTFTYKPTVTGSMIYQWTDLSTNGVTFTADSTLIFQICFKLIGAAGTTASVYFDRYPAGKYEVYLNDLAVTPVICIPAKCDIDFIGGSVKINGSTTPAITLTGVKTDVTCNAGNDGKVVLTPAGGTGTFTYSWTGPVGFAPATTKDISALKVGKYYVTVSSGTAAPKVDSFVIAEPTKIVVATKTIVDVKCFGQPTGTVTLTVSGGTAPYNYLWSSGETTANLAAKLSGTYYATITDAKGCIAKDTSIILQPSSAISVTRVVTDVKCNGGKDGVAALTVVGGTAPYTYLWSSTETSANITAKLSGTYYATVTDAKGCIAKDTSIILQPSTAISVTRVVTDVKCNGGKDGAAALTVVGGTAPYTYLWSSTETSANITAKLSGTYYATVTDAKGCIAKDTSIILQPTAPLSVTPAITNIKCNGGKDGAIALTVAGGTAPYTYAWTGPSPFASATTKDITALAAGDYLVTVTDSKNCAQTSGPLTVTQPLAISVGTPVVTNTGCGTSVGAINITPTNGTAPYTFDWTGPGTYKNTNQNITGLAAGSYTVKITDANNCSTTSTPIVVSSSGLVLNVVQTIKNIDCNGNNNGTISLVVTGGSGTFTYAWTGPSFTSTSKDISALKAGSYTVAITDVSNTTCSFNPPAYTITEPSVITVSIPQITNITCKGSATGAVSITVGGGAPQYSYDWTGPNGIIATNAPAISGLIAGTYNVTITDANGCKKTASATVSEPATGISFGSPTITNVLCFGTSTGKIVLPVNGGTAPYTYSWKNAAGSVVGSSASLDNVGAGVYHLDVSDANGCLKSSSDFTITQPASAVSIAETIGRAADACNGSITLVVAGGVAPYTFAWTGTGVNATAQNQVDLCPGSYNVTVTDANLCRSVKSFNVPGTTSPPIRLTDSVITNAGCPGGALGAIAINFVGGRSPFSFAWYNVNNPTTVLSITQNLSGQTAGKYYVKISDGIQSYQSGVMEIRGSDTPIKVTLVSVKKESCVGNDGAIDIDVTGGASPYTYQWDKVVGNIQDLNNIQANTYNVTVTDVNKCVGLLPAPVVVERILCPLIVTTSEKKDVACFGGTDGGIKINIENGEPGYKITWGASNSVNVNNVPRKDGSYTITGLAAGTYSIVITDAKNQTSTQTVIIKQPTAALAVITTVVGDSGACSGSIILAVTGGTAPYKYRWTDLPGNDHQRDRFDLCAGKILSVEITDANLCKTMAENIRIPNSVPPVDILPNVIITNANCADDFSKTKIDITVKGGIKPYKYLWSNGNTNEDLTGVPVGKYRVTVTDASLPNPQSDTAEYEISAISSLKITVTTKQAVGLNDGEATVKISGGIPSYTVKWCVGAASTTNDTSVTIKGLAVGTCSVEVTDGLGCTKRIDFGITSTGCADVRVSKGVKCFGDKNATATVVGVNDTTLRPPFAYLWDNNESGVTAVLLSAGAHTVKVTGSNGKFCVSNFIVNSPDELKVDIINNSTDCSLQAVVRGGSFPLKYTWASLPDTSSKISNLKAGNTYYVIVKDANGCETPPVGAKPDCREYCLQGVSVITPDDDGVNDEFKIERCQFANVRLQIFSRWGEIVYQNADYSNQWQGKSGDGTSGTELPEGVYFYVLRALKANGIEETSKGTVTILRQL